MQPTETFINAQLLSDGKFYNKIEIKPNHYTETYTLFADGVFKAESVDADNLRTMVGTELGNKNLFTIEDKYRSAYDDDDDGPLEIIGFNIVERPFELKTEHQRLIYSHGDVFISHKVSDLGNDIFLTESEARNKIVKDCKERIEYATQELNRYKTKIDSLTKCLQYYEGENK